jgi:hypothetical protein
LNVELLKRHGPKQNSLNNFNADLNNKGSVGFEVLTAVVMKSSVGSKDLTAVVIK